MRQRENAERANGYGSIAIAGAQDASTPSVSRAAFLSHTGRCRTMRNGSIAVAGAKVASTPSVSRAVFLSHWHTSRCSVVFSLACGGGRGRGGARSAARRGVRRVSAWAKALGREVRSPASWRCVPRRVSASAKARRLAALSTRCSAKFSSARGGGRGRGGAARRGARRVSASAKALGREVFSPTSWRCVPRRVSASAKAEAWSSVNFGRPGALLGSSVAFGSGCGKALPGMPRKAPLCSYGTDT